MIGLESDGVLSSERNGLEPAEAKAADTAPPSPRREAAPINKLNNSTPSAIVVWISVSSV